MASPETAPPSDAAACTVLTGAAGKIGRRLTEALLAEGHVVVATSRRENAFADHPARKEARLVPIQADPVADGIGPLVAALRERGLRPTGLVNNAVDLSNQALPESGWPTRAQWHLEFDLAVSVPCELAVALAEAAQSRLRSVVNVSSMYGIVPRNPGLYDAPHKDSPMHYGVAKAAMLHLTRELAVRLAPSVRVNAVSFGGVEGRVSEAFKQRYARLLPMGRMLREDETTGPVLFLLSEAASGMTGHNLVVDGGWTTW